MINHPDTEKRITAIEVADSECQGHRILTMEVTMPRIVLAEFNTHRIFSRNSRSTRAVPTPKLIAEVRERPYIPLRWGLNKPGMQATEYLDWHAGDERVDALHSGWVYGAKKAAETSEYLFSQSLHKQWAGRPLEPYIYTTVLVTSTEWSNFLLQRDSALAQPEIELLAQRMKVVIEKSRPYQLQPGQWHLPYVSRDEQNKLFFIYGPELAPIIARKVSVARCARVSYSPFEGGSSYEAELARYDGLRGAYPPHWSPFEHVARADTWDVWGDTPDVEGYWHGASMHRNFTGWCQYRALCETGFE